MENRYKTTGKTARSILATLPMFLIIVVFSTQGNFAFADTAQALAWIVNTAFFTLILEPRRYCLR